jgi:hypothetical protein
MNEVQDLDNEVCMAAMDVDDPDTYNGCASNSKLCLRLETHSLRN